MTALVGNSKFDKLEKKHFLPGIMTMATTAKDVWRLLGELKEQREEADRPF